MSIEDQIRDAPAMTRWFNPGLLFRLIVRAVVSATFGAYADRRLIQAALDKDTDEDVFKRSTLDLKPDGDGEIWIDYVADLGDGFDATYAVAWLLAQEKLEVDGHLTKRGQVLIMGGDQVYPDSSRANYRDRLLFPYSLAFPDTGAGTVHTPVFLIPGNHDWYDGLVMFLGMFCKKDDAKLGNWRARQERSYFAIELTKDWWVWGIDIQLSEDIDQPQEEYFQLVASKMATGANVILCTAVPGWLTADELDEAGAFGAMGYVGWIAWKAKKDLGVPLVLSGDTHHYSRYDSPDCKFIVAGGGGAFLHGTHQLKDNIPTDWLVGNPELSLRSRYPEAGQSRRLLRGNLRFAFLNWDFSIFLGVVYALSGIIVWLWAPSVFFIAFLFFIALASYAGGQEKWALGLLMRDKKKMDARETRKRDQTKRVISTSLYHAGAHAAAVTCLAWAWLTVNAHIPAFATHPFLSATAFLAEIVTSGALVGGFIYGVYLMWTSRDYDLNHNDAFSAMRLDSYRHFLRMRLKDGKLTIFPIGLDRVPDRQEWKINPVGSKAISIVESKVSLQPSLIEEPIEVIRQAKSVKEVAKVP